jgi:glycosyltransferase involved in cell wall biosynthesis
MTLAPKVSIVTTVYDRVDCLARCLASVKKLTWEPVEHIVVADDPPSETRAAIATICEAHAVRFINMPRRANDWGNTPASTGLHAADGKYVCFLSDDNAYLPRHLEPLVWAMEEDPGLGMAYSSCLYNATRELRLSPPLGAGIDLGQPLWRRAVLRDQFQDVLPFSGTMSWDWEMIRTLVYERGVTWRHVDELSFVFRLAVYPRLMAALA